MVLDNRITKIAKLDIVANIGDVWRPCEFRLKTQYCRPIISMRIQHCQRLPDRQEFKAKRSGSGSKVQMERSYEKSVNNFILHLTSNRYMAIFQNRLLKLWWFLMIIEIVREYIRDCGKSRYQLSKDSGVGEDQLCRIMQGKTCTLETADKLCKYFKLNLEGDNQMRTHKRRDGVPTATFEELNFKEQSQSITATINTLERMINSHIRRAREEDRAVNNIRERRLDQVQRMINRIRG